jgi:hypothetical protein
MRKLFWLPVAFFATVISVGWSFGDIEAPDLTWGGFASLRLGQIVKGEPETFGRKSEYDHVWVQEMNVGLSLASKFNNLPATGMIGLEVSVNNDWSPYEGDLGQSRRLNFYPYISRADLLFNLIDGDNTSLMVDVGYFPYKYNNSVRNLGEYLFRSGTYPQYLITEIDFPMARLMGIRVGGSNWGSFSWDVLLTTNVEWTAIGDVNLSGIASWKPLPLFEIGGGFSWCSIISVDWDKTTPSLTEGPAYLDLDPETGDTAKYYYTFAGQKVMGRMTFDLKQILPWKDIFGEEDLKLYGEGAILGLVNYPISMDSATQYDTLLHRVPIMAGFNWPTHPLMSYTVVPALMAFGLRNKGKIDLSDFYHPSTLVAAGTGLASGIGFWFLEKKFGIKTGLDLLNIEVEYFGNPYVNSYTPIRFDNEPIPLSGFKEEKQAIYMNRHDDDWKWSIYGKKTFAGNFSFMFEFARDHIRWYRLNYAGMDGKEALRKNDQWHYTFKFGYSF